MSQLTEGQEESNDDIFADIEVDADEMEEAAEMQKINRLKELVLHSATDLTRSRALDPQQGGFYWVFKDRRTNFTQPKGLSKSAVGHLVLYLDGRFYDLGTGSK